MVLGEVGQPGRHVLETQMLHLDVGAAEALNALLQKLERQVRFVARQVLAHHLDEDRVV